MTTKTAAQRRTKMLERGEEAALARAWLKTGDVASRNRLIMAYRPLAVAMANETARTSGAELDDLVQEAFMALTDSIDKFDPSTGNRFGTFARWHIVGQLKRHVMDFTGPMRVGTNLADKKVFMQFRRVRAEVERASGTPIDDAGRAEIARKIGVPLDVVKRMEPRCERSDVALDKPPSPQDKEVRSHVLADGGPSPEALAVDRIDGRRLGSLLGDILSELPAREQAILKARILNEERVQLRVVGRRFGITKERVRQLERKAIRRLRRSLKRRGFQAGDFTDAA